MASRRCDSFFPNRHGLRTRTAYIERVSSHDVMHLQKAKKAIRKAFEVQKAGGGFSLIEVLSTCPTGWGIDAYEALDWIKTDMIPVYPLGVYKDSTKETK